MQGRELHKVESDKSRPFLNGKKNWAVPRLLLGKAISYRDEIRNLQNPNFGGKILILVQNAMYLGKNVNKHKLEIVQIQHPLCLPGAEGAENFPYGGRAVP